MIKELKFSIAIIIISFFEVLYKIYPPSPTKPAVVPVIKHQFSRLSRCHDYTQHGLNDVNNQLIDLKNFTFKINAHVCSDTRTGVLLLIIICTEPDHFKQRLLIRSTWGRPHYHAYKVVFLMGKVENDLQKLIEKEGNGYGDIVQGNFIDAFENMTYKHAMGLKWVSHHCPMARYVLKVNDDFMLSFRELLRFLVRDLSPWGLKGLITCKVHDRDSVQHSDSDKWKASIQWYAGKKHPNFCANDFILYSQDVVHKLLNEVQSLPYFWMDDIHITGVAAERLKIPRTPLGILALSHTGVKLLESLGPKYLDLHYKINLEN